MAAVWLASILLHAAWAYENFDPRSVEQHHEARTDLICFIEAQLRGI